MEYYRYVCPFFIGFSEIYTEEKTSPIRIVLVPETCLNPNFSYLFTQRRTGVALQPRNLLAPSYEYIFRLILIQLLNPTRKYIST